MNISRTIFSFQRCCRQVYKKYEEEIERLQEDREDRANKLHGSITEYKKRVITEVEKTVDAIEGMFKDLKNSKGRHSC